MSFFGKKNEEINANGSNVWEKEIGNANSEMDVALSFEKNPDYKGFFSFLFGLFVKFFFEGDVNKLKTAPFQLQVFFVSQKTGAKCVRFLSFFPYLSLLFSFPSPQSCHT